MRDVAREVDGAEILRDIFSEVMRGFERYFERGCQSGFPRGFHKGFHRGLDRVFIEDGREAFRVRLECGSNESWIADIGWAGCVALVIPRVRTN